jgi:hypothetical protein
MSDAVYFPKIKISVYTEREQLVFRGTQLSLDEIDKMLMDYPVISVNTQRGMNTDCPVYTITLAYQDDWFNKITSNDLLVIEAGRLPQEKLDVIFIGLVDDCRKHVSILNNEPTRVITITGRGTCKALEEFEVGIIRETDVCSMSLGWMINQDMSIQLKNTGEAVDILINNFLGKRVYYEYGNGKTLKDFMSTSTRASTPETLPDISGLIMYQGNVWSLFKEIQNAPFNELFWEIYNRKATLVVRECPFNPDTWNTLETVELNERDVIDEDLGRSDLETYTMFMVGCKSFASANDAKGTFGRMPLYYPPYMKKYGIRKLEVNTLYAVYANSKDTDRTVAVLDKYRANLFNWNIKNNSMYNGTIVVKGSNKYKVGQKLQYGTLELYIEAVAHNFEHLLPLLLS